MPTPLDDLLFRIIVRKEASADAAVNQFLSQIRQIQGSLDKTTSAQKRLSTAQRTAQAVMSGLKRVITGTVGALGGFLVLRRITRLMTDFETKIAEMATVISGSSAKVEGMRREIIKLSRVLPQSAAELGAAAYQIFSAQILDSADALDVLAHAAKAAVAGVTDTETATVAMVSVLNAFRLEASEAERIADILFRTVELGIIKFPQLSKEIGTATTSAALAGVTIEELAAAIATITLRGIPAAEATTSLNRLFIALTRQTKAQKDAFKALGVEFSVETVRQRGFIGLMEEINKLTKGQIDRLSELFPNIRAARAAFILAGTGVDQYRVALEKMMDNQGAAARAFNLVANTSVNAAKLLKNNFNATLLELSESILPAAITSFEFLIDVLDRLRFRSLQSPQFISTIETMSNIAHRLIGKPILGEGAFGQDQRAQVLKDLTAAMSGLVGITNAFGESLSRQSFNIQGLASAVRSLTDNELIALKEGVTALLLPSLGVDKTVVDQLVRQWQVILAEFKRRPELQARLLEGRQIAHPDAPTQEELLESAAERVARRSMLEAELARRINQLTRTSAEQQLEAIRILREKYEIEYKENIPEAAEEGFRRITAAAETALRVEDAKVLAEKYRTELERGLGAIDLEIFETIADLGERDAISLEQRTGLLESMRAKVALRLQAEENSTEENEELRKVLVEIVRLLGQAKDEQIAIADEVERATRERFRDLQLQLSLIRQTIDGVIELANAFGVVDDEVAKILRNMEQVGIGIATLIGGISSGNPAGIAAGVTSLAGGLAGLGGTLFGGESEAARRLRETMEENTRAVELLTESMSIQVQAFGTFTRNEMRRARQLALGGALSGNPRLTQLFFDSLTGGQQDLLERIAQTLGVTLDGTRQSFEALKEAIDALDITRLTEDFDFAMGVLQQRFDIFDIDDPIKQFEALIEAARKFGVMLPTGIGGEFFDITTGKGRQQFEEFIQLLFERTLSGDFPIPKGMTLDQWLAFLVQMESLLDQIEDATGDTKQFAISRTITQVTGSRIAALLFGIQFETTRIADNSDLMVALLTAMAGSTAVLAPAVTTTGLGGQTVAGGGNVSISVGGIDIDVHIIGDVDISNAAGIGQEIGDNIIERIDKGLGDRLREAARLAGEVILT